jgi:hypothetical protein
MDILVCFLVKQFQTVTDANRKEQQSERRSFTFVWFSSLSRKEKKNGKDKGEVRRGGQSVLVMGPAS